MNPFQDDEYEAHAFHGLQASHVEIGGRQFLECSFEACNLTECIFAACRFQGCTFKDCDLSLAQFPGSRFSDISFEQSKLVGVDWTLADWNAPRLGDPFRFHKCLLSHSTFLGLELPGLKLLDCQAKNVDFREAKLSKACFKGTDLEESLFSATDLSGADLRQARNYHLIPSENVLRGARFSLPEALSLLFALDIILDENEPPA